MALSRIKELTSQIQSQTSKIEEHFSSLGLPPLSFDLSMPDELPPALHSAQNSLLEAADELTLLVQGPLQSLMHLAGYSHNARNSLQAIVRFDLATAFPIHETATFDAIARARGLDTGDTTRILRHAMTYRIFSEPTPGLVAHTACSRLLAQDPIFRGWIATTLDELLPAASRMVDAMERWPGSQEPNQAGWNVATGESKAMFEVLGADDERMGKFANSMTFFEARPGIAVRYLVEDDAVGWDKVKKMVDIGGSHGKVGFELARKYPELRCVVQDLDKVISGVPHSNEADSHVTFMAHNFFEEQPIKDADLYLFRWVLHDWSDPYAVRILRALVPALRDGTKIVINEACLPDPGAVSLYKQRFLRATDLTMKQLQNARERDREDWKSLLKLADPRFKLLEIKEPQGSELAIIIVVFKE